MDSVAFLAAALQAGLRPAAPCRDRWTVEQVARLAGAKRCTEFLQASVGSGPGAADGPRVMPANTWDHPPAVAKMRAVTDPRDPEEWSFNAATVVVDVLIDEKYRGRGLGKWLMSCVVDHPNVKNTNSLLGTRDAHGLYEQFGFEPVDPERFMEIRDPDVYKR